MDELELLKKDWQKDNANFPKLSYDDIYKMILKKSSSIVKWIFIISILEFVFWTVIAFAFKDSKSIKEFDSFHADYLIIPLTVLGYLVLGYFFYLFFRNYKRISVTDNAKNLMENILNTRRTVRHYVAFNLVYLVIATGVALFVQFDQNPDLITMSHKAAADGNLFVFYAKFILITAVFLVGAIAILLFFYWLIYGILLKRLNRNYKELKKLEV
ncbi:hypothetical protein M0G43_13535 [Subsaxibacter sp. CAU 1640]|uniref:hypothetical protein n=1 Tax=Subsaxibacter sp. CAU 1640 TaxID=2933271 RepID=UPI002006C98A|nr:hypothetical protein [Subsaxibacter sp. CAU 1640]MCK7591604.1 hypothetical protein [Subsaxibacter sp. CAU 1640]